MHTYMPYVCISVTYQYRPSKENPAPMLRFKIDDKVLEGFQLFTQSKGIDDERNACILLFIEDSYMAFETDRLNGQPENDKQTIRCLMDFLADTEYVEPEHLRRILVFSQFNKTISYNPTWRS